MSVPHGVITPGSLGLSEQYYLRPRESGPGLVSMVWSVDLLDVSKKPIINNSDVCVEEEKAIQSGWPENLQKVQAGSPKLSRTSTPVSS